MTDQTLAAADLSEQAPAADDLQIGWLQDNDANFRVLSLWLAKDPLYGLAPVQRLGALDSWLRNRRVVVATRDSRIVGALAWAWLREDAAVQAIETRTLPSADTALAQGNALLITMVAGSEQGMVKRLTRRFIALNKGRLMLYERHSVKGGPASKFGWIDRNGVVEGPAIERAAESQATQT